MAVDGKTGGLPASDYPSNCAERAARLNQCARMDKRRPDVFALACGTAAYMIDRICPPTANDAPDFPD
jgi:hypothetical protein